MNFEPAEKMKNFEAGIFQILDKKKKELEKQGKKIYNFSVGTPDFETPECVMKAVSEACLHPENYHYSLGETEELLEAVVHRYKKRYQTDIAKNEIMSVYGSQEGMAHIFLPLINPGDIVLLPNPGYPIFSTGAFIAQSNQWFYPLTEENNYLPDFDAIPQDVKEAAKIMVVSYPANPICKTAPDEFYEELFRASVIGAQIVDEQDSICYISDSAKRFDKKIMKMAKEQPVDLGKERLLAAKVHGGYVLWLDDISKIKELLQNLEDVGKELSRKNEILKAEISLEEKKVQAKEQARLYDKIAMEVKPQLDVLTIHKGYILVSDSGILN